MNNLTKLESQGLIDIQIRLVKLKNHLKQFTETANADPRKLLNFLLEVKAIVGNLNNSISFTACLLAKEYLEEKHKIEIDVALKPQGAPGLDVDEVDAKGNRIIAEIKTLAPYKRNDFGAAQKDALNRDFVKLSKNEAKHKYLFVTEASTYDLLITKYRTKLIGVRLVSLRNGKEYDG